LPTYPILLANFAINGHAAKILMVAQPANAHSVSGGQGGVQCSIERDGLIFSVAKIHSLGLT